MFVRSRGEWFGFTEKDVYVLLGEIQKTCFSQRRLSSFFKLICIYKHWLVITASWEDLAAVIFVSNKFMSSCVICVIIGREIFLLQSDCPAITKVHNKFKNSNKNGNFAFKCCWWPVGVCSVPSECLSAKICCSWSSDKFAKRATCEFFFNSVLFLLLVGSGPKRSMPIEKLGSSSMVSSVFKEAENCTAA